VILTYSNGVLSPRDDLDGERGSVRAESEGWYGLGSVRMLKELVAGRESERKIVMDLERNGVIW